MDEEKCTPRSELDETIIGGLIKRYLPDPGTAFMVAEVIVAKETVVA